MTKTYAYDIADFDLSKYDSDLLRMQNEFSRMPIDINDKSWVKSKISHMVETDQYMRNFMNTPYKNNYTPEEQVYFQKEFMLRFSSLDKENTAALKKLLTIYEWFSIGAFGEKADMDAWLLVQHADQDLQFQKEILIILKKLYPIDQTNKSNYAYLFDRVKAGENRPQRYGTQGHCVGIGKWEPSKIADASKVDQRRIEMGLVTMAIYKTGFKDICKKPDR
jgi:hypothetical protein